MKIKTKFVPKCCKNIFTANKEYTVYDASVVSDDRMVINDNGHRDYAQVSGLVWEVVKVNFDITKHEWEDDDISACRYYTGEFIELVIDGDTSTVELCKSDIIAMAKTVKLTPEDLT